MRHIFCEFQKPSRGKEWQLCTERARTKVREQGWGGSCEMKGGLGQVDRGKAVSKTRHQQNLLAQRSRETERGLAKARLAQDYCFRSP